MKLFSPKIVVSLLIFFFLSAGLAYVLVPSGGLTLVSPNTGSDKNTAQNAGTGSQFSGEPLTAVCPLNGKLYTESEKALWSTRRPILTMLENSVEARPQSGLSSADIVYEAVAEGGITRFMGVFYCGAQSETARVAPVRSARIYFVNIAAEYNTPVYMHVGGGNCSRDEASGQCTSNKKAWALEELQKLGWRKAGGNDFDTISDTGYPVLFRDYNRLGTDKTIATEHTMVGSLAAAWKQAQKRGFDSNMPNGSTWLAGFIPWKNGSAELKGTAATDIKYDFWKNYSDFAVEWKYDSATKEYQRNQAGAPHIDLENKKQITATNVVIQFAKEEGPLDEHKHMFYTVIGQGTGFIFRNGQATETTWKKATQTGRTVFSDKSGKEIVFTPGVVWVSILPIGNIVTYN